MFGRSVIPTSTTRALPGTITAALAPHEQSGGTVTSRRWWADIRPELMPGDPGGRFNRWQAFGRDLRPLVERSRREPEAGSKIPPTSLYECRAGH